MLTAASKAEETEIHKILEKNADIESITNQLSQIHQNNKVAACEFLLFAILNEIYSEHCALAFKAVFLKFCHASFLFKYIHFLWTFEKKRKDLSAKFLFAHFFKDPKLLDLAPLKIDDLKSYLEKVNNGKKLADVITFIESSITKFPLLGPEPPVSGTLIVRGENTSEGKLFDNFKEAEEIFQRSKAFSSSNSMDFSLDFAIPIPSEIPLTEEEMMTPFPFILDAPLINPCLRYNALLKDLFKMLPKLTDEELTVT